MASLGCGCWVDVCRCLPVCPDAITNAKVDIFCILPPHLGARACCEFLITTMNSRARNPPWAPCWAILPISYHSVTHHPETWGLRTASFLFLPVFKAVLFVSFMGLCTAASESAELGGPGHFSHLLGSCIWASAGDISFPFTWLFILCYIELASLHAATGMGEIKGNGNYEALIKD